MTKKPTKPNKVHKDRARRKISRTIALTGAEWDKLDAMRGKLARGVVIAHKLKLNQP